MWKILRSIDLVRPSWSDVKGVRLGFAYLFRGAHALFQERQLWSLLIAPALMNGILFLAFVLGSAKLLGGLFAFMQTETWWQVALVALAVFATIGGLVFIGSAVVIFIGSIVSAPFYDAIAQHITRKCGGIVVDRAWWSHFGPSVWHAAKKLWWYLLIQAGLIILYIVPGAFGPIAFVTVGFMATAFFLALDFLDFSFDFHGWTFAERRRWCLEHKGLVLGFGSGVFLGLGIPVLNLFIPPIAVAGSVILFSETYVFSGTDRPR